MRIPPAPAHGRRRSARRTPATMTVDRSATGAPGRGSGDGVLGRPLPRHRGRKLGGPRGRSLPLPDRSVQHCVGWLRTSNRSEPALRSRRKRLSGHRPERRTSARCGQAPPAPWPSASKTATVTVSPPLPRTALPPVNRCRAESLRKGFPACGAVMADCRQVAYILHLVADLAGTGAEPNLCGCLPPP